MYYRANSNVFGKVKKKKIGQSAAKLHICRYEESSTTISVKGSTLSK